MAFPFSTPRLIKLRPVPAWSPKPLTPRSAGPAAAAASPVSTGAGRSADPASWGRCEIVLAADRTPGATHKFFHDWRFEAIMRQGEPEPGTVLAVSPITPRRSHMVAAADPVSLVEHFHAGAPNPQTPLRATFTWTLPPNHADRDPNQPLVLALTRLRQQLREAGWQPSAASATRYQKPAPAGPTAGDALAPAGASLDRATEGAPHGAD
jgi:hypothetical protein